ncbi:uncharacterized protein [Littorina saxatilis]|uniref:uncharacterized protein n=1 Tax=Littorina saxatilis TaxID=31220 RepID=UPI0038B601FE
MLYSDAQEHVGIEVCDIADHVVGLRSNQTYSDIQLSNATRPVFTFGVPGEWTNTVYVRASSSHGDVHISISDKTWMTAYDPAATDTLAEGYSHAAFTVTDITLYYVTVTLSSDSPEMWNDVTLEAGFTCVVANQTSHGYFEHLRKENCEGRSY